MFRTALSRTRCAALNGVRSDVCLRSREQATVVVKILNHECIRWFCLVLSSVNGRPCVQEQRLHCPDVRASSDTGPSMSPPPAYQWQTSCISGAVAACWQHAAERVLVLDRGRRCSCYSGPLRYPHQDIFQNAAPDKGVNCCRHAGAG